MKIKKFIRKFIFPNTYSSEAYIKYLRNKGISIGEKCYIWSPNHTFIDPTQGFLLKIGDFVKITRGVTILAHDYSVSVSRRKFKNHVGAGCLTVIGNNVFIGMNAIILPGSNIGDNTIVGAGAVVSGTFSPNSVIAGNPARIICTLEEFYIKRRKKEFDEACNYVKCFKEKFNRLPNEKEMGNAFIWLYLPRTSETIKEFSQFFHLSGDNDADVMRDFLNSKPSFNGFEDFINKINGKLTENK